MKPGIFNEFEADQLVRYTVEKILAEYSPSTLSSIPVEIQHDMVMTPRHKVGSGTQGKNWVACKYGANEVRPPPLRGDTNLEWAVS